MFGSRKIDRRNFPRWWHVLNHIAQVAQWGMLLGIVWSFWRPSGWATDLLWGSTLVVITWWGFVELFDHHLYYRYARRQYRQNQKR